MPDQTAPDPSSISNASTPPGQDRIHAWALPGDRGTSPLKADVVVIGAGSAGITAAVLAASLKRRVILVERDRTGGECLFTGCIPSKTLLALAKRVHAARSSAGLGLQVSGQADWPSVQAEVRRVIDSFQEADSPQALERSGVQVIGGTAVFVSPHVLEVRTAGGTRTVMAGEFVLATGSQVTVPDIEGLLDGPFLTHETVFDLPERPDHLLVLGGGPIGCELSQAFARLGSRVTLVHSGDRLLPRDEPEASAALKSALEQDGVQLHLNTEVVRVEHLPSGVRLHFEDGRTVEGSHLLLAVGKTPRVKNLGLEVIGAEYDEHGLKVGPNMRSVSCPYLLGAGDVVGGPMFTHGATERGTLAGLGVLGWWGRGLATLRAPAARVEDIPWVTYTDPEIGHWGMGEDEAVEAYGDRVTVVEYDFSQLDRAVTEGEGGFVKLIALKGHLGTPIGLRVVGVQVVGSRAGELIQLLSLSPRLKVHPVRMALLPVSYPTFAEATRQTYLGLLTTGAHFGKARPGRRAETA